MNLPSHKSIGIVGGGQLGKMLIESSRPWNVSYVVLENQADCPASLVADEVIVGSLYDEEKIRELASKTDVLTFEIEHIHVDALLKLEAEGKTIIPSPKILKIIQDKGEQKQFYSNNHIPTVPFLLADRSTSVQEIAAVFNSEKIVVKSRMGGYDGKGVEIVEMERLIQGSYQIQEGVVIEAFQGDMVEISVIVARDTQGNVCSYDPIEMYFNPDSNLVEFLFSPANISKDLASRCCELASSAISKMNGFGLYAVEMFVTGHDEIFINEIAPRPHNSGHHTIEGAFTSQFEQLNRILLSLPLGSTQMVCPAAMINLVGPGELEGDYHLKETNLLLQQEGVYIHLYNKKHIKPNRKMGHITVLAENVEDLINKAEFVKQHIDFE